MSVRRSDWAVIGINIGMEHYDDDNYDDYDEYDNQKNVGDMTYLIDGMSGKYFIVGEVVAYGDEDSGFSLTEISLNEQKYNQSIEKVKTFIQEEFNIKEMEEPKLMILTHWE